jgi:hypothetical protein
MTEAKLLTGLDQLASDGVSDLLRRVQDINNSYRAVAEKMGQLYMSADELKLTSLTKALDKPMRNASDNEQMFAAILEELQLSSSSTQ